jgi:hypothetical protein
MANALTIRVTAPGAKEAAGDIGLVQSNMKGLGSSALSSGLGSVSGKLQEMSRNSRLLNRETRGISTFAGAIDTIAGTNLSGTIQDLKTVAEVVDPIRDIGKDIQGKVGEYWTKFTGAMLPAAATAGEAAGAAEGEAQGTASAETSLEATGAKDAEKIAAAGVTGEAEGAAEGEAQATAAGEASLAGAGAKDAEKIAAASATGEAEGVAEGEAMGGTAAAGAAASSGKGLAGSLGAAFGPAAAVAVGAAVAYAFDQAGQKADAAVQSMGEAQAKAYSGSFSNTIFSTMYQALAANHMEGILGTQFQNTLEDLGKKAGEGAGAAAAEALIKTSPQFAHAAQEVAGTWDDIWPGAAQAAVGAFSDKLPQFVHAAQMSAEDAAKALSDQKIWDDSARSIDHDLASTLEGNTDVIDTAMKKVIYAIQNPLEDEADTAMLEGAITMLQYRRGLAGNSNEMNNVLDQQITALEHQWELIEGKAYDAGAYTAKHWANGYVQQWSGNKVNIPGYQGGGKEPPPGHGLPHHAMGGHMAANEPGIVGETGAELWIPDTPGTVVPKPKATGSHGWSGGGVVNVYNSFTINGMFAGPAGLDALQRELDLRLRQTTRGAMRQAAVAG